MAEANPKIDPMTDVESRIPEHYFTARPEATALDFLEQLGEALDPKVYISGDTLYLEREIDGRPFIPALLLEKGTTAGRILWPAIAALYPDRTPSREPKPESDRG